MTDFGIRVGQPKTSHQRDWGLIMFTALCVGGMLFLIGFAIYWPATHETRQEHLERIDREIKTLQQQVAELQKR